MSINVFGGRPNAVVCKTSVSFATAGITSGNTAVIYLVDNPLISYVPGRAINGITGFVADKGYYIVAISDMDLTTYVVPPTVVLTQLATPGSFTAVHSGSTGMALNWAAVTSATGYVLQRALDSGFTSGVTTLVAGTNVLTFTDSGLTASTQYFYRVKAQASGFLDSNYASANDTTSAAGPAFVTWSGGVGSGLEQYNASKGVRTKTGETGAFSAAHEAWSVETLTAGHALTLKCGVIAGGHGMFGLNGTRTANYSGTASNSFPKVGFQLISGVLYYTDTISANTSTGYSPATGDLIRLTYSGSTIVAEYSTNAGSTWNALHTFSTAISGSFLFGMQLHGNITNEGFDEISIL